MYGSCKIHLVPCSAVLRIRDVYPGSGFFFIPDPGSRISDPKSNQHKMREKIKLVVLPFFKLFNFLSKLTKNLSIF